MRLKWLNGTGWETCSPVPYKYGVVPVGFKSDGITLMFRILHVVIDRQGKALRGAIIHDYMYVHAIKTKKHADMEFKRVILNDGVPWLIAQCMYGAVRLFGRGSY